jgi:hypothetical protein
VLAIWLIHPPLPGPLQRAADFFAEAVERAFAPS